MSENRDARGAPRAPKAAAVSKEANAKPPPIPSAANAARSPKPPAVAAAPAVATPAFRPRADISPDLVPPAPVTPPALPEVRDSEYDLVDSGGWDTADTVSLKEAPVPPTTPSPAPSPSPVLAAPAPAPEPKPETKPKAAAAPPAASLAPRAPQAPARRAAPPVAEKVEKAGPDTPRRPQPPPITSPGLGSITTPMAAPIPDPTPTPRQPVVRSDESVGSLIRAAVEEAVTPHITKSHNLEAVNRELAARVQQLEGSLAKAQQEVEIIRKASTVPLQVSVTPQVSASPAPPKVAATPAAPAVSVSPKPKSIAPMKASMTSYGPVLVLPEGAPRPGELDLSNVGPIDLPDFGSGRRLVGRMVVVVLLGLVVASFVAMVISRNT